MSESERMRLNEAVHSVHGLARMLKLAQADDEEDLKELVEDMELDEKAAFPRGHREARLAL